MQNDTNGCFKMMVDGLEQFSKWSMMSLKLHRQNKTNRMVQHCTFAPLCFSRNGSNEFETTFGTDQMNGTESNNIF